MEMNLLVFAKILKLSQAKSKLLHLISLNKYVVPLRIDLILSFALHLGLLWKTQKQKHGGNFGHLQNLTN